MDVPSTKVDYKQHESKCRICLAKFGGKLSRLNITNAVKMRFHDVTQIELKISSSFSKYFCSKCDLQLKSAQNYKSNIAKIQQNLHNLITPPTATTATTKETFIDVNQKCEEIVIKCEVKSDNDDEDKCDQGDIGFDKDDNGYDKNDDGFSKDDDDYFNGSKDVKTEPLDLLFDSSQFLDQFQPTKADKSREPKPKVKRNRTFICDYCVIEHSQLLKNNNNTDTDNEIDKMPVFIGDVMKTSKILEEHILTHHSSQEKKMKCPVENCGKLFLTAKRLSIHNTTVHRSDAKALCIDCGVLLCSKANLRKHIASKHLKVKNFTCDLCSYQSTLKSSMKSHMRVHQDPEFRRVNACDVCDFISVCAQSLRRHKQYEHSGQTFTCQCGKSFSQKGSLQMHIKCVHDKIKNHTCHCGKSFFTKKNLMEHQKMIHNPHIKNVACEICGRMFCTQRQLARHLLYHKNEKFECDFDGCDRSYVTKNQLERHKKIHEGNRDFLCHLCNASYFYQKDLQRHLDVAHKQTTYFCELCSFTHNRKDYLGNHIKSSHRHLSSEERTKMLTRVKFVKNNV